MRLCAGVCHLERAQLSQNNKKKKGLGEREREGRAGNNPVGVPAAVLHVAAIPSKGLRGLGAPGTWRGTEKKGLGPPTKGLSPLPCPRSSLVFYTRWAEAAEGPESSGCCRQVVIRTNPLKLRN